MFVRSNTGVVQVDSREVVTNKKLPNREVIGRVKDPRIIRMRVVTKSPHKRSSHSCTDLSSCHPQAIYLLNHAEAKELFF